MLSILGSQLAFSAATTLAKKTFEFSITSSLKGLSDVIRERFEHSRALQEAQAELELKVRMLCLPVDILAHHATRGNTALQEPLGVALGVLEDVEACRQSLVAADVARAQDAASPDANASAAQLARRLRELVARLDSVLPYLSLAISTVALLNQGAPTALSPSRLLAASSHLRAGPALAPGAAVFCLPEASWHEERALTTAGPSMAEVLRLCSLTVRRAPAAASSGGAASTSRAGGGQAVLPFAYELLLEQDLEDGVYHDEGEAAQTIRLQVADIIALEWQTTQGLSQGENEFRPALVLHMLSGGSGWASEAPAPPDHGSAARPPSRARSSRRAPDTAAAGSASKAAEAPGSPTKAAAAGQVTPPAGGARPSPSGAGVGGSTSIRRCAIMLNRHPGGQAGSDDDSASDDGSQASAGASSRASSSDGEGRGRSAPPAGIPAAAQGGGGAGLQREWALLGELEYVLRLALLECREQAPHQDITDERILMGFQATSVPPAAAATLAAPAAYHPALSADSALQRRGSAAARWRSAAAGAAHVLRDGVEAATVGLRQLSFSPAASGAAGAAAGAGAGATEAGGSAVSARSSARRSSQRGRGFGSPVQ